MNQWRHGAMLFVFICIIIKTNITTLILILIIQNFEITFDVIIISLLLLVYYLIIIC